MDKGGGAALEITDGDLADGVVKVSTFKVAAAATGTGRTFAADGGVPIQLTRTAARLEGALTLLTPYSNRLSAAGKAIV